MMEYRYICKRRDCYLENGALEPGQVSMVETFPGNQYEPKEFTGYCPNCNEEMELLETYMCEECNDWFHLDDLVNKDYFYLCEHCNREGK